MTEAAARLRSEGYRYEVLQAEQGREHLDPSGEHGLWATLKRMASAFGDQKRILDDLGEALDEGKMVISAEAEPDKAEGAIQILQDAGGEYIWKFGTWTYTHVGK